MRIGIFGGTFDPPHIGHISACKAFLEHVEIDVLYIIPVYMPPHKNISSGTDECDRLEMSRRAFEPLSDKVFVSDLEIKRGGRSYTADTIKQIKSENENAEIFFLCGTDMILTMDCWYKPEYIFANATIVYARRESETEITEKIAEKCELYKQKFGAHIIYTENNAIEASSTEIREAVIKNDNASGLLSKAVYDYIKEKNLYKS
ncbi:MAG: nicotinate (nicotinamide) nucleotide adenylyltransferase [Clostridia bacterium]|nr:nicotinate (nicotinamide) nucleotide adenylyltransferase [Clostridia bacterium]